MVLGASALVPACDRDRSLGSLSGRKKSVPRDLASVQEDALVVSNSQTALVERLSNRGHVAANRIALDRLSDLDYIDDTHSMGSYGESSTT